MKFDHEKRGLHFDCHLRLSSVFSFDRFRLFCAEDVDGPCSSFFDASLLSISIMLIVMLIAFPICKTKKIDNNLLRLYPWLATSVSALCLQNLLVGFWNVKCSTNYSLKYSRRGKLFGLKPAFQFIWYWILLLCESLQWVKSFFFIFRLVSEVIVA